ncbi:MAG: hypothetical protein R3A48_11890 [Polyangiales bacterium]
MRLWSVRAAARPFDPTRGPSTPAPSSMGFADGGGATSFGWMLRVELPGMRHMA